MSVWRAGEQSVARLHSATSSADEGVRWEAELQLVRSCSGSFDARSILLHSTGRRFVVTVVNAVVSCDPALILERPAIAVRILGEE